MWAVKAATVFSEDRSVHPNAREYRGLDLQLHVKVEGLHPRQLPSWWSQVLRDSMTTDGWMLRRLLENKKPTTTSNFEDLRRRETALSVRTVVRKPIDVFFFMKWH